MYLKKKTAIDIKNDIASTTIQVYVQSLSVQQLLPAGDLCSPTFFFEYLRQLTAVLSNGRSCPIRTVRIEEYIRKIIFFYSHS